MTSRASDAGAGRRELRWPSSPRHLGHGVHRGVSDQLDQVYDDIQSSIGFRTEPREVTSYVVALSLLLGLVAAFFSLRWFARLP